MSSVSLIYLNTADATEARRIGMALVETRLAAAANVLPGVSSIFRWQDEVQERTEAVLVLKTATSLVDEVVAKARSMHSYECPSILSVTVDNGNADYLDWIGRASEGAG